MDLVVELLASHHNRAAFSCGVPSLDAYLHKQAGQDMRRDLAVCYVLQERGALLAEHVAHERRDGEAARGIHQAYRVPVLNR